MGNDNKSGNKSPQQPPSPGKQRILENDLNKSFRPAVKPGVEKSPPPKAPAAPPKKAT